MAIIQFKRGTLARWIDKNPILAVGEPGYVTDNGKIKIGDGVSAWEDLNYVDSETYEVVQTVDDLPKSGDVGIVYFVIEDRSIRIFNNGEYFSFCSSSAEVGEIRKDLTELQGNFVTLESDVSEIKLNTNNIQSILNGYDTRINNISSTLDKQSDEIAAIRTNLNNNMSAIETLSEALQKHIDDAGNIVIPDIESINQTIANIQSSVSDNNDSISNIKSVIGNVDNYFENDQNRNNITDRLSNTESSVNAIGTSVDTVVSDIENVKNSVTDDISSITDTVSILTSRVDSVTTDINQTIVQEISKVSALRRVFIRSKHSSGGVVDIQGNVIELPDMDMNAIYMLPKDDTLENTEYEEYMVLEILGENDIKYRHLERIGSSDIALDNYTTKDDVVQSLTISFGDSENKETLYSQNDDDKDVAITIPKAGSDKYGVVKSSTDQNKITVLEDGTMEITQITPDKIFGSTIVFYGGNAGASGQ